MMEEDQERAVADGVDVPAATSRCPFAEVRNPSLRRFALSRLDRLGWDLWTKPFLDKLNDV